MRGDTRAVGRGARGCRLEVLIRGSRLEAVGRGTRRLGRMHVCSCPGAYINSGAGFHPPPTYHCRRPSLLRAAPSRAPPCSACSSVATDRMGGSRAQVRPITDAPRRSSNAPRRPSKRTTTLIQTHHDAHPNAPRRPSNAPRRPSKAKHCYMICRLSNIFSKPLERPSGCES